MSRFLKTMFFYPLLSSSSSEITKMNSRTRKNCLTLPLFLSSLTLSPWGRFLSCSSPSRSCSHSRFRSHFLFLSRYSFGCSVSPNYRVWRSSPSLLFFSTLLVRASHTLLVGFVWLQRRRRNRAGVAKLCQRRRKLCRKRGKKKREMCNFTCLWHQQKVIWHFFFQKLGYSPFCTFKISFLMQLFQNFLIALFLFSV